MTTGDIVIFTGRTETFYDYEEPTNLVIGKAYEIESVRVYNWRTDFRLKGEKGTFSSTWFTEAPARRRFKFMVMRDGRAHFIVNGNVVFDTFDDKLGTISDLFNFAMNNRLIIDFQNMVVRKAWWPSFFSSIPLLRKPLKSPIKLLDEKSTKFFKFGIAFFKTVVIYFRKKGAKRWLYLKS